MRHLDPRQPQPSPLQAKQRERRRSLWPVGAAVLALALAGGWGLTQVYPPFPADKVSQAEVQKREEAFRNVSSLPVAAVPAGRTQAALATMKLSAADQDALRQDLAAPAAKPAAQQAARNVVPSTAAVSQQQPLKLVELVLWDTDAMDGDLVRIVSGGFTQDVPLAKTPAVVVVPYATGASLQVMGVRDGGGGITLGLRGSDNSLLMPVMSEGQVLTLPVRVQ